jgi:hypothetical protein
MPHKYNADRRHRIPKTRYKVMNWRDYEAGLRPRRLKTNEPEQKSVLFGRRAPQRFCAAIVAW